MGAQTWWGAAGASGAETPGSRSVQNLGFLGGQKPSNRSEAVVLSQSLDELLSAHRDDRQLQLHDHDSVFTELVRQVTLHCAERVEDKMTARLESNRSWPERETSRTEPSGAWAGEQTKTVVGTLYPQPTTQTPDACAYATPDPVAHVYRLRRFPGGLWRVAVGGLP